VTKLNQWAAAGEVDPGYGICSVASHFFWRKRVQGLIMFGRMLFGRNASLRSLKGEASNRVHWILANILVMARGAYERDIHVISISILIK
jgi:hypothetical protein